MAESKSGGGSSATQDKPQDKPSAATQAKQNKTDTALKQERGKAGDERYGGDEPLPYPEHEPLDTVTYKDPRPLDWPQKADRSVFIGVVHKVDNDPDADDPKGDYVYANDLDTNDDGDGEIELSGGQVEHAQVVAGGGRLTLIINGDPYDLTALGGGIQADLGKALQLNANS